MQTMVQKMQILHDASRSMIAQHCAFSFLVSDDQILKADQASLDGHKAVHPTPKRTSIPLRVLNFAPANDPALKVDRETCLRQKALPLAAPLDMIMKPQIPKLN